MKVSRTTLQTYFEEPLPSIAELSDAFTFHAFEIDSIDGDVLDIKVLPNRAADCNSEEGIAAELSAILNVPLKNEITSVGSGTSIRVTTALINSIIGSTFSETQVTEVLRRLRLPLTMDGDTFIITPPKSRPDLTIQEDIAEEVGRILGYDLIPAADLPPSSLPVDQSRFHGIERMKDQLVEQGYTEVSTQSFAKKGDITLANPLDKTKPALRTSLEENIADALARAKQYEALLLPPKQKLKLFEVGTVFPKEGEYVELRMSERVAAWGDAVGTTDNLTVAKLEDYGKDYIPKKYSLGRYKPFSLYPFITRDVAVWVPSGTESKSVEALVTSVAGELLARIDQFDSFQKEGRVSLAFRLVFQSMDRTLTDEEVQSVMTKVSGALTNAGYEVR